MAGNTKLLGFSPRSGDVGGVVNLERWGEQKSVEISQGSVVAIRTACAELPSKPPEQQNGNDSFKVRYDESVGRVLVDMDPRAAKYLENLLEAAKAQGADCSGTCIPSWMHHLRVAAKAHEDFHNIEGEPGVEDIR